MDMYQKRNKRKETRVEREEANLSTDTKINWYERIYVPCTSNHYKISGSL